MTTAQKIETTDLALAQEIEAAETSGKPASKSLLRKAVEKLRARVEQPGVEEKGKRPDVELPDGSCVSAAVAKFLHQNQGAEYVGVETLTVVRVTGGGSLEREELLDDARQRGDQIVEASKRTIRKEYLQICGVVVTAPLSGDQRGEVPVGQKGPDRIFLIQDGGVPRQIGFRIAYACLLRLKRHGSLSAVGRKLFLAALLRELNEAPNENEHESEEQS